MASRNSETGSNIFSISENELQEYSETNESSESSLLLTKHRNISGKKQGDIWLYVNQGVSLDDMHMHLARQCLNVPDKIKYFWRDFIAKEKTSIRKKTKHNQSDITINFPKVEPLFEERVES
ncbi:9749_t:CDS:2 [Dentiscutata erythropus]|uniref:9749_t:CDS:1 n=1 Tax=Dentiscutata erythropus TaxID=1348616 RepID=A0A9N9DX73_9GLOM|nr:9749_t:CDS:2 [Dentiscutata erythropus]